MTIFMHKLDEKEKTILSMYSEYITDLEIIYEDAEMSLRNKDSTSLLKRIKERRDKVRARYDCFLENLVVNGKAVNA